MAPKTFTSSNKCLHIILKKKETEAGTSLGFLRLTMSFENDRPDIVASYPQSLERARKLLEPVGEMRAEGAVSVASLQKLGGKLRFA